MQINFQFVTFKPSVHLFAFSFSGTFCCPSWAGVWQSRELVWVETGCEWPTYRINLQVGLALAEIPDNPSMKWIEQIKWDEQGLVPVIAQELTTGDVLMFAWMNREALQKTAELGRAVYFSRSRGKLWFKGEESGHVQTVHEIRADCDSDVLLLRVTQLGHAPGIACHTGRHSCFFSLYQGGQWTVTEPVLKDPQTIYK